MRRAEGRGQRSKVSRRAKDEGRKTDNERRKARSSQPRLDIPRAVRQAMVAHARRDAPDECCGLLVGGRGRVAFALPMANRDPRPRTGFRMDPAEHIAARRVLRRLVPALEIVGVYHSHPSSPAVPSDRDIREAHYPEWVWVIVGTGGRSVKGFRIKDEVATAVPIAWT